MIKRSPFQISSLKKFELFQQIYDTHQLTQT